LFWIPNPGNYAQPNPGSRRRAVNNSAEQVDRACPKQRLINIGRIKIADREKKQTSEHAGAGESDRPDAATELACEHAGKSDRNCACQRWKNPQCEQ